MDSRDFAIPVTIGGAGVVLYTIGEGLGGVPDAPVAGTALIYASYLVMATGGVLWLREITRPLWRRQLPKPFRLLRQEGNFRGERAGVRYETKFTIDLCGAPLPRALRLECDQPILGVEWYTTSDFGAEWNEDLARAGDSLRATTARRVSDRDVSDAVRFQLVVLADKVVNIEKLRVVTPPAAPQSPKPTP